MIKKTFGLYNMRYKEQCEYVGTTKEIANYLGLQINTLRVYLVKKRKGKQKLLLNKYELVELVELEEINE